MDERHNKNTIRYFLVAVLLLVFLFFSNDFGLIDVQKTAIVTAVGIDREDDEFILTSQIAIPQSSKQGQSSQAVQLVSRGKTVAQAFEEIYAKTGWYPKLVFCNLIILGEGTAQTNAFDALDYFLRDNYLSDNCQVATCDGLAKSILDNSALVDSTSSLAIEKVLSAHAERVGTALPTTLREFAIGYFSDSKSSRLPVIKKEPQQEPVGNPPQNNGNSSGSSSSGGLADSSSSQNGANGGQSAESEQNGGNKQSEKPVFSASETALFVDGKRVDTLTKEQTFALGAVTGKLRLASYSVERDGNVCTLSVRQNSPKTQLTVGEDGRANFHVALTMTAGIADYSKSLPLEQTKDMGDLPVGIFSAAEKRLASEIQTVFEKTRACGCDVFGLQDRLVKYEQRRLRLFQDNLLDNTTASVSVHFENVR